MPSQRSLSVDESVFACMIRRSRRLARRGRLDRATPRLALTGRFVEPAIAADKTARSPVIGPDDVIAR
jgi:hypothetical protein